MVRKLTIEKAVGLHKHSTGAHKITSPVIIEALICPKNPSVSLSLSISLGNFPHCLKHGKVLTVSDGDTRSVVKQLSADFVRSSVE